MIYLDEKLLGEPYMTFSEQQKKRIPSATPVINCHIQRGAVLGKEKVQASLNDSYIFFKTIYPEMEYKAFLCYSWLLYPNMLQLLSKDSNIRQFAEQFEIIGVCNNSEQAFENIFGINLLG